MSGIKELRKKFERKKGRRDQIKIDLNQAKIACDALAEEIERTEEAQIIIKVVAKQTQDELEYRITEPVSLAQAVIYENPYKQIADFQLTARGMTECHLLFERNDQRMKPSDASGGGPIDVASYGLRLSSLSLTRPKPRNVLLLDEPLKWLHKKRLPMARQMLKETSEGPEIQIIMVTHLEELMKDADRTFEVEIEKGISYIK
jgi:hypothetical protein